MHRTRPRLKRKLLERVAVQSQRCHEDVKQNFTIHFSVRNASKKIVPSALRFANKSQTIHCLSIVAPSAVCRQKP